MIYLLKILKIYKKKFLKKISPGFWSNSKIKINDKTKFIIDLSNPKISHFGDNLFFISAFKDKEISNFKFLVSKKYFFLWEKFGFDNMATKIDEDLENYIYVSTLETNFLNKKFSSKFLKKIFFDFTDHKINSPLFLSISSFFGLKPSKEEFNFQFNNGSFKINNLVEKPFYLFNDIIYSRQFLRKSLSMRFIEVFKKVNLENTKIFFIGSSDDLKFKNYHDQLVDLRGKINFDELTYMLLHENCNGFIGLDNGLMHLSLLLNKKARIVFRGKFSKRQSNHHFKCINISMNEYAKKNIQYI